VEVPLNVTDENLLGGLDFERTIATGVPHVSKGILAKANRRVLFVQDANLLDPGIGTHIAQALDSRYVRLEREGFSETHEADFTLIGTFDPADGDSASPLRDRVGLIVELATEISAAESAEFIERAIRFEKDPLEFAAEFAFETAQLKSEIEEARARLPRVRVLKSRVRQIAQIAVRLGVEGNRADVFALRAARANAALAGRASLSDDDLLVAIQLVLAPRATILPQKDEQNRSQNSQTETLDESDAPPTDDRGRSSLPGAIEDLIIQTLDAQAPEALLPSPARRTTGRARSGRQMHPAESKRGRYVRSSAQKPRHARVAIDATLRAAAPWQQRRASDGDRSGASRTSSRRVRIEPDDLRFKRFKHRSGILFIFAVDTSGSMALNRMAHAKGALTRLLQRAYRNRDMVALISFRGDTAKALLAPTRSVEIAKRLVDWMPAGGGTPVAAGIVKSIEVARVARLRGMSQTVLVLFTDGRANVGRGKPVVTEGANSIGEELTQLGQLLRLEDIRTVVVDTKSRFVSSGEGECLARVLGARYFYLPRSDAKTISDAIIDNIGPRHPN